MKTTKARPALTDLENRSEFVSRHIGPNDTETSEMLSLLKIGSLDQLVEQTVPAQIRSQKGLDLGESVTETAMLAKARRFADQNQIFKSTWNGTSWSFSCCL